MKLPLKWLREYVDFNVTVDEFVEKMMWRGFEIAEVIPEMPGISGVVVCKILSVSQHENADKLKVCSVDIGKPEPLQIVTNAQNLYPGALCPVALDGATLSGGFEIHPTVMRGVESFGMFCSGKELNLIDADYAGMSEDSVFIFRDEHPLGQSIQSAVGLDSVVFDIELTPNRADCQSIVGICREAAAALGQHFTEPVIKHIEGIGDESEYASVTIKNAELCPRYTARVVTDLNIEPSPQWMQKRLRSVGLRPINNIVDITNYIMVEYGHPMHAFDLACVKDGAIVVRNAIDNEKITTLDGKERTVNSDMLLIADPEKGVGLAGVMGGENSEITAGTKACLFESAVFIASNIRATSRKLRHTTDSAQRFMRGVEPVNAYLALERAIELVDELKAGKVIGKVIDVCNADLSERVINCDCNHINHIIGSDFAPQYMSQLLEKINIKSEVNGQHLTVNVPAHRVDIESGIERDHDIAEEVARLHGYDKLEATLMYGDTFTGALTEDFKDDDKLHDVMTSLGAYEMYNYNFMSPTHLDALRLPKDSEKRLAVKILNPFGDDQSLMRTTLIPGVLNSLATNQKRKTGHGRFYEIGNVHFDLNESLPQERKMLCIGFWGTSESFFTLKGTLEQLFDSFGIENARFSAGGGEYLCPGKMAVISIDDDIVGEIGALHPDTLGAFELSGNVFLAELSVSKLLSHKNSAIHYKQLPKFPVVERDIAVVVDDTVTADEVKICIESCTGEVIVENVRLFDVYRGKGIEQSKKSMAYSFTLRREDRTLADADIAAAVENILSKLSSTLNATLRS